MSASQEKRRRIEEKKSGVVDKRAEKNAEAAKAVKKTRTVAIIVVAVVVILLAAALIVNSDATRRNATAINVGGIDFSVAEYNYYFYETYYEYYNNVQSSMSDYASTLLPDTSSPMKSQIYDEATGETWADFFDEMTIATMQEEVAIYNEAMEKGYTLSEDEVADIDNEFAELKETVESQTTYTLDKYLASYYGAGMTEKVAKKMATMRTVVTSYSESVRDSFTYTQEQLDENYESNKDTYDIFNYRYFLVYAEEVDESAYDSDEAVEAAEAEALEAAKDEAAKIAKGIKSEADFIAAAKAYDAETYAEDDSTLRSYKGELLGSTYGEWLQDASRKAGDVTTADVSTGCYVVYFISRTGNDYKTANAHIVTINPLTVDYTLYENGAADEEYIAAVNDAYEAAVEEANNLYTEWSEGDATLDAFITMYNEHSDATAKEDGYYEELYVGSFGADVTDWLLDTARKEGDSTVIVTDDACYIIYFDNFGAAYRDVLSDFSLRTTDYTSWKNGFEEPAYSTKLAFNMTK